MSARLHHERVSFRGAKGVMLDGRLERPEETPVAYALFAHCFTCSKDVMAATRLSRALTAHGIAVLRFDFTGLGGSQGDFANTNFSSNIDDLVAAATFLRMQYAAPALLIGHSLGGTAALAAAGRIEECRAVATINAPRHPDHIRGLLRSAEEEVRRTGRATVEIGGREFQITAQFLDDVCSQDLETAIAGLDRALIVFQAPDDEIVPAGNAQAIFDTAHHPKEFVSLAGADHLLSEARDATYVGAVIAAWADRYLREGEPSDEETVSEDAEEKPREEAAPLALEGHQVAVAESDAQPYGQILNVAGHTLTADEPEEQGGQDSGPSPYDLLLAALGVCTSITLRMYADRKEWPLERLGVRLKHGKVHAEDCASCETEEGRVDRMEIELELTGDLDGEQRNKLLDIANKCPVHRTLASEVVMETRLAADRSETGADAESNGREE